MFAGLNIVVILVFFFISFGFWRGARDDAEVGTTGELFSSLLDGTGMLLLIWFLFALIPGIAVSIRRLHDAELSGWWYVGLVLASAIPLLGILASIGLFVVMLLPGSDGSNRFGPDPREAGYGAEIFS